jgi:hypothetical protein
MPDSGGAIGEQDGNAVDDGIAAIAAGAAHGARIQREGLAADGADEESEWSGLEREHRERVLGSRFELRGTMGAG